MASRFGTAARSLALTSLLLPRPAAAQQRADAVPTITAKVAGMQPLAGFMPLYLDERAGKV